MTATIAQDIGPVTWPEAVIVLGFCGAVAFIVWCLMHYNS